MTEICILNVPVWHEKYAIMETVSMAEYFPACLCLCGQVTHTVSDIIMVIVAHTRATMHCKAGAGQCSHHSIKKQAGF